jgi:DNA-binding NtrC family response regulator
MKIQTEDWKLGNVRELKAKVDAAKTVKQDEPIDWEDIPETAISILYESDAISLPNLPLPLPLKSHKDYDYNDAIIDKARNLAENDEEVDRLLGQGGQRIEANRKQRKKLKK